MSKKKLGRGLGSLIPQANSINTETGTVQNENQPDKIISNNTVLELDLTNIIPNDQQPRTVFDDELISELAESIVEKGVIQPIVVTKLDGDDKYMIIEGERRWRASGLAGKTTIPAVFRKVDTDIERLELALITNAQREDLNPVELARAYKKLMVDFSFTQDDLGKIMGRSRSAIANRLRLLNLPEDILQSIEDKVITEGHGKALLSLSESEKVLEIYREIVDKELSVRDAEKLVTKINKGDIDTKSATDDTELDPHVNALREEFEHFFSSKVIIKERDGSGSIEIKYKSHDDLDRIIKRIRGELC